MRFISGKGFALALSVVLLGVVMSGCPVPKSDAELQAAYEAAVADAEVAEASEISRELLAITPYNPRVTWEGVPGESRVLMVTWTSYTGYDDLVGKSVVLSDLAKAETMTTRDVWVTAAMGVQFAIAECKSMPNGLVVRLEQLLGLPPNSGKTRFVEFWVDPQDLFRPSPDPEISDSEAELDFQTSDDYVVVSPEYITWFEDLKASSYGEGGYPWTRLGYTYDWGNPCSEIGLSEFVIRTGATVDVHSVTLTEDYFE
ncbi:MAG: hypothetical protein K1Y02_22955 [Candidatus Hydrogenedentes bacterium]|nr:hypothetical protein [Candidatus Hydrogenedentota bacterium]